MGRRCGPSRYPRSYSGGTGFPLIEDLQSVTPGQSFVGLGATERSPQAGKFRESEFGSRPPSPIGSIPGIWVPPVHTGIPRHPSNGSPARR